MAKNEKDKKVEEKPLYRGYCDTECEHYKEEEMISFAEWPKKNILKLCCFGNSRRSFGCLNSCPNKERRVNNC